MATAAMASTAVFLPRLPTGIATARCTALPNLPPRPFPTSIKLVSGNVISNLFVSLKHFVEQLVNSYEINLQKCLKSWDLG